MTASSAVGLPATVATLALGLRSPAPRPRLVVPAVWAASLAAIAGLDAVAGLRLLDVVLGCSIAWFVTPAALAAWGSTDVSGIAATAWWVLALEGLVYGSYGLIAHIGPDRVFGVAALVGAAAVLSRLHLPEPLVERWVADADSVELAA
jgi:hypothetical protein